MGKNGHMWVAPLARIKQGSWCKIYSIKDKAFDINHIEKWAKFFGGYCLSAEYINAHATLIWQCKFGHEWQASYSRMKKRKNWCTKCLRGDD